MSDVLLDWVKAFDRRLCADGFAFNPSEQVTVNHYVVGGGIGRHRDEDEFGNLAFVSLEESCVLEFTEIKGPGKVRLKVEGNGSAYVLRNDARWKWQHAIPDGMRQEFRGRILELTRERISVCFRSFDDSSSE